MDSMEQTNRNYLKIDAEIFNYYLYIGDGCVCLLNHDNRIEERNEDEDENENDNGGRGMEMKVWTE
ncbi:hypothetical protein BofuT4_P103510.1 [Botrytis cinerea T4]|uniref:Uncharacterized protein n=1 Tax=Botryotinia fuckeliana (strain T4) TaxID=999810 RepID=G2YB00_BOTF4|nr:hypothetical protein BofuT4_P103510.1 [Botrytis cinerea T4]